MQEGLARPKAPRAHPAKLAVASRTLRDGELSRGLADGPVRLGQPAHAAARRWGASGAEREKSQGGRWFGLLSQNNLLPMVVWRGKRRFLKVAIWQLIFRAL